MGVFVCVCYVDVHVHPWKCTGVCREVYEGESKCMNEKRQNQRNQ